MIESIIRRSMRILSFKKPETLKKYSTILHLGAESTILLSDQPLGITKRMIWGLPENIIADA